MYKPELFDVFKRTRAAEEAARDVRAWLGAWGHADAVLELGAVLAARELTSEPPPSSHELFSRLRFVDSAPGGRARALDEDGVPDDDALDEPQRNLGVSIVEKEKEHGWLESDLIEDA